MSSYRDVEALGAAGIPVYGEAGHGGGYRLLDGFRTRLTGLTAGEAGSLGLAALPRAAADLGLEPEARAAWIKMVAALPPPLRQAAAEFDDRFHVDVPAWYHEAARTPALADAAEAIRRCRVVRIRYLRWAEPHEITRTERVYGPVSHPGRTDGPGSDGRPVRKEADRPAGGPLSLRAGSSSGWAV
jgi:predicted DNA-binding transcriptional regulator YafY